jgi:hypothetical protein
LDYINEQALLIFEIVIEHEDEPADGLGLGDPLAIMRHVLHRLLKAEITGVEPGPLEDPNPCQQIWGIGRKRQAPQQISPEFAGKKDFLPAIAVGRPEGISRQRIGNTGQDGQGFDGTIFILLALTFAVVGELGFFADLEADG